MKITIIGGHGKVALLAAPILAGGGHEVVSAVRNEDHRADVEETGAQCVVADVEQMSTDDITELLTGSDAVVWSAGAGGGSPERTYAVDRDAAIRTIDAAGAAGATRFIMVSYVGSGRDDVAEDNPFHHYAEAKAAADEHLRASPLAWTILGPGELTDDEATMKIDVGDHVVEGRTSRGNVAHLINLVLPRTNLAGLTLNFRDGALFVDEVLDSLERQVAGRPIAPTREGRPARG